MDNRHFDELTRRIGELTAPSLPRRGVLRLLGAGTLAGALGLTAETDRAGAARCKKIGKKCNKKKCRKKGKKCCCNNLKCKKKRCKGKGGFCPITVKRKNVWGSHGGGNGDFRSPWGIDTDNNGNVYVADTDNDRVQIFNARGRYDSQWGQGGSNNASLLEPIGIGVNQQSGGASGRRVFVSDPSKGLDRRMRQFRTDGTNTANMGSHNLTRPQDIAIDHNNNAWVVDRSDGRIFLYDRGGNYVTHWTPTGNGALTSPEGIAVYRDDKRRTFVYVTDAATNQSRVHKFRYVDDSASGLRHVKRAGSRGSGRGSFNQPAGLSVDACGNLWVADRVNNRIQILNSNLKFISRFTAGFNRPTDTAISHNKRFLYVVDSGNARIQRFRLKP